MVGVNRSYESLKSHLGGGDVGLNLSGEDQMVFTRESSDLEKWVVSVAESIAAIIEALCAIIGKSISKANNIKSDTLSYYYSIKRFPIHPSPMSSLVSVLS